MRKICHGSYVVLDLQVHLASTLALYALLLFGWGLMRLTRAQPFQSQRAFHWVIAVLTPLATVLFFFKIHAKDLGIRACGFSSPLHIFTLLVDAIFFLRFVVEIAEGHFPHPISSLTDCWLLVNTVWKMVKKTVISEYQFLVMVRFLFPQTLEMYTMLLSRFFGVRVKERVFQVGVVLVGVFIFAGAVQTAEEWSVLLGIHPDAGGEVTAWHTYWDYIYMGYITVSTVGYGDMTPSTVISQVIVVIAIIGLIMWYTNSAEELYLAVRGVFLDIAGYVPPLPLHRRLVIVGNLRTEKMQQLLDELSAQNEAQIIVGTSMTENLSLPKIPGMFVIRSNLKMNFFRKCFPKLEMSETTPPVYTLMVLNQENGGDSVGNRNADLRVLSLVQMVKDEMPYLPVVTQVCWRESRVAVENIDGWGQVEDQVVCYEDLMAGLVAQAVAAEGSASILATLITTPPSNIPPVIHPCTNKLSRAHHSGQVLMLAVMDHEAEEEESFDEAALKHYFLDRVLLLGYVQQKQGSVEQDRCHILPTFLPSGAPRVLLVPPDLVSSEGRINIPASQYSGNIHRSLPDSQSPSIRLKNKTLLVVKDGPKEGVARNALRRNIQIVSDDDFEASVDAAALLELDEDPGTALYNYYCAKAHLAEISPWAPLISNVEHGLEPGVSRVSVGCPHACTTFLNPSIVTSATCLAYKSDFLFGLWKFLVEDCLVVEVEVKGYYCYGKMFQYLLTRRKMLAVGATVQMSSHSRASCSRLLNLDNDKLAVTNPDFDFCLHPGDKVVALPSREAY